MPLRRRGAKGRKKRSKKPALGMMTFGRGKSRGKKRGSAMMGPM